MKQLMNEGNGEYLTCQTVSIELLKEPYQSIQMETVNWITEWITILWEVVFNRFVDLFKWAHLQEEHWSCFCVSIESTHTNLEKPLGQIPPIHRKIQIDSWFWIGFMWFWTRIYLGNDKTWWFQIISFWNCTYRKPCICVNIFFLSKTWRLVSNAQKIYSGWNIQNMWLWASS